MGRLFQGRGGIGIGVIVGKRWFGWWGMGWWVVADGLLGIAIPLQDMGEKRRRGRTNLSQTGSPIVTWCVVLTHFFKKSSLPCRCWSLSMRWKASSPHSPSPSPSTPFSPSSLYLHPHFPLLSTCLICTANPRMMKKKKKKTQTKIIYFE